jgi:hypothetical protein
MNITDFFPKYPNILQSENKVLNPYDEDFYESIFHKKEFYELKLEKTEDFPKERGMLTKYQKTIARYMSSHTPYDKLLLVHQMGLGKCVSPDTIVYVDNDAYEISQLWEKYNSHIFFDGVGYWATPDQLLTVNAIDESTLTFSCKNISRMYKQFIYEKINKIQGEDGYNITMTKSHKILTDQGWKSDVKIGDYIAIPRKIDKWQNIETDSELMHIIPWQITRGRENTSLCKIDIYHDNRYVLEQLSQSFHELKTRHNLNLLFSIHKLEKNNYFLQVYSPDYFKFLEDKGYVFEQEPENLFLPQFIMNAPGNQLKIFLREYYQLQGKYNSGEKEFPVQSKILAHQLKLLLANINIMSNVDQNNNVKLNKIFSEKFTQNVILLMDNHNSTEVIDFVKVTNVEEINYQGWVYDLEVQDNHNYLANGIITHNTCSAIGAIEQIKNETATFDGAIIFAKGEGILDNFTTELVEKCTSGYYIPENYSKLTEKEKIHRVKKKIDFYQMKTFAKFAKKLSKMSDEDITENYSNKIIVIDEVHNLRPQEEKGSLETYTQFHRLLHLINNCKVLFLSGTPMKDGPEEIASVANLFLPLDNQFPTDQDFLTEYMDEKNDVYYMKKDKIDEFKQRLKGKISFLREPESNIEKKFIGDKNFNGLKHFIVQKTEMSSFQSKYFEESYEFDKSGKKGVYTNSRESSLFVYPDGSYGKKGFEKYIQEIKVRKDQDTYVSNYKMIPELVEKLQGKTKQETLKNIAKYSSTYAKVIEKILTTKGNCFVYSSIVQGSGCILFSLLLDLVGFSKASGKEREKGLRYGLLTQQTTTVKERRQITNRYNRKDNIKGDYIKVIIGSRVVSEGYSFRNVIFESINTPHWNYSEIAQAIARGIRLGSHNDLVILGETPKVEIMQPVAVSTNGESVDLFLYQTSEDKDISIRNILRLLMETAFDCALNYIRNYVNGADNSRDCDYNNCKYTCDGINMDEIYNGIPDDSLDYSTYQLYYSNPKVSQIRKKIEQLFRENRKMDLESIIKNLSSQFNEEEIKNALTVIEEETQNTSFDYKTFLNIYARTPVQKIAKDVEQIFKTKFQISFEDIVKQFSDYTEFEVLSCLQYMINENLILYNKYGFPCYLREDKNIYFVVNTISTKPDFFSDYYSQNPHILSGKTFAEVMQDIYNINMPKLIKNIINENNINKLDKLIKFIPEKIQEMLIETSIQGEKQKIQGNKQLRETIINLFKTYIKEIDNIVISTFPNEKYGETIRCFKNGKWKDCDQDDNKKLVQYENKTREKMRQENPYGIMGKYNPENGSFCIVDFLKEQEIKEKMTKEGEEKVDNRISYSGKVCTAGGWKLNELIGIVCNRLKIDPPPPFRQGDSINEMLERINSDDLLRSLLPKNPSRDDLRRILYWGTTKREGGVKGIKPICEELKNWFKEKGYLEIDNQCGVQGKKKITEKKEEHGEKEYRIEIIVPSKNTERIKSLNKDINKVINECFDLGKYNIPIDDTRWIVVFSRKKIVAVLTLGKDNNLSNVCVAKNYRRKGNAKNAVKQAMEKIAETGKRPILRVDNRDKHYKKLIRMYQIFGFEIKKMEELMTTMEFVN